MIEDIEAAVRSDLESDWPGARLIDRRANVGFSDGKTTSHTFRIHTEEAKYELVVGPRAVRSGRAEDVIRALREEEWIDRLKEEIRLLVEETEEGYVLGPRPDGIVL